MESRQYMLSLTQSSFRHLDIPAISKSEKKKATKKPL